MTPFQKMYPFHLCAEKYTSNLLQSLVTGDSTRRDNEKWDLLRAGIRGLLEEANRKIKSLHPVIATKLYTISE